MKSGERKPRVLPALALLAAALAAHGVALGNGFVWDDKVIVVDNPDTRDLSSLPKVLLSPDEMKPYYRPLTRASFLLDYRLFGFDARAYHLVNLLLHLSAVLLLYTLGRQLFESRAPALAAALLLAVHPIHCEAVAFVSARNNIFALCFGLLSLLFLIDAAARRSHARAAMSALAFFAAVAAKEPGAMVLPILALWLYVPALSGNLPGPRRWTLLVPHIVAAAGYFAMRIVALGAPVASEGVLRGLWARLAQNYWVLPRYLLLAAWPSALGPYHQVPEEYASLLWPPLVWMAIAAAIVLIARRPSPASVLGLLWFALNLVPIVNLVPIPSTAMAERFFYIPAAGLWLVVADLLWRLPVPRRVLVGIGAAAVVVLGVRAALRDRDWRDDVRLFASAVATEPSSVTAHFNYGNALKDVGDLAGAETQWVKALAIQPLDPGTHAQLGTLAATRGDYATAERHYRIALRGDVSLSEAHLNLARICERTGRPEEAREHYLAAAADPGFSTQARARMQALAWPGWEPAPK
jgi:tetratricopeptide (TPR) repeat protein